MGLRQSACATKQPSFVFVPALPQARDVFELRRIRERRWRTSLKAFQPNPFATIDMCQRVAHGAEARAHRLDELLSREAVRRVYRPTISPRVVFVPRTPLFSVAF